MGTLVRIGREGEPKTCRGTVLLIIKDGKKNMPAFVVQTNVKTLLNVAREGQFNTAPIQGKKLLLSP